MFLKKAQAENFRNYEKFSLEFSSPLNVFTGENGQGKSSFLEAVYCALRGRSFHQAVGSQFIQKGKALAKVHLNLEEEGGRSEVLAGFSPSESGLKKEIFYCGKKTSPAFLIKKFPVFVFTESSMKSIRQGPEQRRAFIDELLYSKEQKKIREDFNRCLKQKKILLKNIKQGFIAHKETQKTLQALNHKFLELSFLLVQERLSLLKELFSSLKGLKESFFKQPAPELGFSYVFQNGRAFAPDLDIPSLLAEDLKEKEEKELLAGLPLSGPQKHEIIFTFNGEDSRVFCSKGEQRLFVLSLMASHIQKQPQAMLFLDDVLMELDEKTQDKFLQFLEKSHCQTFLTNCKVITFKTKNMSFFSVKNGIIRPYE